MRKIQYVILLIGIIITAACGSQKKATVGSDSATLSENNDTLLAAKVTAIFIDANKEKILGNFRQAMSLYRQCIGLEPNHAPSMYELARLYHMQGSVNDALELAQRAVEIDPGNKWYNLLLASLYEQSAQFVKAIEIFEKLHALYPKDLEYLYETAMLYLKENRFADAIAVYDKIEKINGSDEEIIIQKQKLYLMSGQTDKAISELEKLIQMYPGESRYYALLTELYLEINNYPKAIESLEKIRELDPQNPYIPITLAEYYFKTGELERAFQEMKTGFANPALDIDTKLQVLFTCYTDEDMQGEKSELVSELADVLMKAHPNDARPFSLKADLLLRQEQYKEAAEVLRQALKIDNSRFFMWETLLRLNAITTDTASLRKESLDAIEIFPLQPLPYLFAGLAYYQLHDYAEAIKRFNAGKELVVDDDELLAEFYMHLGDAYSKEKLHLASDAAFDKALLLDPENPYILNNYSYYLALRNERLEYAEIMSAKSLNIDPDNKHYLDTYGWIMYQMGKYEEARVWIEKSIKNNASEDALVLEHLGDALFKLGNKEEAIRYWKQALEMGGEVTEFLEKKVKDGTLYE